MIEMQKDRKKIVRYWVRKIRKKTEKIDDTQKDNRIEIERERYKKIQLEW